MSNCNACHTSMEGRLKLEKEDGGEPFDATLYRKVIGSLRYLVNTRPDIAHAVGIVSWFMEKPSTHHWAAVKQILRYITAPFTMGAAMREDRELLRCLGSVIVTTPATPVTARAPLDMSSSLVRT